MKADNILKADIIDIIFEHKNKDYGAYDLRKHYHERIYKALAVIFTIALILGLIGFFYKHKGSISNADYETIFTSIVTPPVSEIKAPETPKPPQRPTSSVTPAASTADNVPVIVEHTTTNIEPPGDAGATGPQGPGDSNTPAGTPGGGGETVSTAPPAIPEPPKIDKDNPLRSPDIMPSFPGGIEALRKFLKKNLVTPKELESDETISVTVQFVVGYDGILKSLQVVEDGGEAFNNEVIRVIKKMPAWIPGKSHGENVSVYYSIPIKFTPMNE